MIVLFFVAGRFRLFFLLMSLPSIPTHKLAKNFLRVMESNLLPGIHYLLIFIHIEYSQIRFFDREHIKNRVMV